MLWTVLSIGAGVDSISANCVDYQLLKFNAGMQNLQEEFFTEVNCV